MSPCASQFLLFREPGQGQGALGLGFQSWSTFPLVGSYVAPVAGDGWSATACGKLQQAVPGWGTRWNPSPQDLRMWLHLEIRSLKRWLSSNVIVRMGHWSSMTECPLREETRTQTQTTLWIHRTIYKPKRGAQKNPTLSPDPGEKKI